MSTPPGRSEGARSRSAATGRRPQGAPMSAVLPPIVAPGAGSAPRSEGVWHAAWRRLRADRLGIFAMAVVVVFLLMIVLTASGLVARGWQKEVAVPSAPPTFVGAASAVAAERDRRPDGADRRHLGRRPARAALQGMGRARRPVQDGGDAARRDPAVRRRPARPRRPRQGDEGNPDLGLRRPARRARRHPDRHRARSPRRLLRRQGGRLPRVALQRLHLDPRHPPDPVVRGDLRPRHRQRRDHPGAGRLDRRLPPGAGRVHQALDPRLRALGRGDRRLRRRRACSATSCPTSAT